MKDLFTWQIGSERPPNVCLCCGLSFDGKTRRVRGPYRTGPYIWVCEACWSLPFLFFPDKVADIRQDGRYVLQDSGIMRRYLTSQRLIYPAPITEVGKSMDTIQVPVIRLEQKDVPVFSGKMKAKDLLALYDIKRFSQEEMDWYQRQRFQKKANDMKKFLATCPIAVVPAVLLGVSEGVVFTPVGGEDIGIVEIPRVKGVVNMIDGQHRLAGFDEALNEIQRLESAKKLGQLIKEQEQRLKVLHELMEYDIPVVLVDSRAATKAAEANRVKQFRSRELTPVEAERVIFFILNKTQKGLNPSHKDQLAYRIWYSGIRGIPVIEEEEWRAHATRIVEALNNESSPLANHIVDATSTGMGRRVRLSSFVGSLGDLFDIPEFFDSDTEEKDENFRNEQFKREYEYVSTFWSAIRGMYGEAFSDTSGHLLLRSLSVYAVNRLAADVFTWSLEDKSDPNKKNIEKFLAPLEDFDWSKEKSDIKGFGGQQGALEAYKLLLTKLEKGGNKRAGERRRELEK